MRSGKRTAAIVLIAGLVCALGKAEDAVPGAREVSAAAAFGVRHPVMILLRDPTVRKELQLTPEQAQGIDAVLAEVEGPLWRLRDVTPEQAKDESLRLVDKARTAAERLFTAGQLRRFEEVQVQAVGLRGLVEGATAKKVGLTPSQQDRIRKLLTAPGAATTTGEAKREGDLEKRVLGVLSARQRQELARVLGAPFATGRVKLRACIAPELQGVDGWINSDPLTLKQLRGKVVLFHFWTYGCGNCVRNLPYYKQWHEQGKERGLVVLGVHTPETEGERNLDAVRAHVQQFEIAYPVAVDNGKSVWKDWANRVWPSIYLVDRAGYIRYWWYGEVNFGGIDSTRQIQNKLDELLAERE